MRSVQISWPLVKLRLAGVPHSSASAEASVFATSFAEATARQESSDVTRQRDKSRLATTKESAVTDRRYSGGFTAQSAVATASAQAKLQFCG
jgi:hypothetical protein